MPSAAVKTVTIRLPEDLHHRVKVKLVKEQRSFQDLLEEQLRAYVGEAPADPNFQRQIEIARRGMSKYREALSELAK
ncbi:MAG: AbrB/MazE/SpoVT family DNA-binding domain-containing protein [Bryobacteraceae bacterium]